MTPAAARSWRRCTGWRAWGRPGTPARCTSRSPSRRARPGRPNVAGAAAAPAGAPARPLLCSHVPASCRLSAGRRCTRARACLPLAVALHTVVHFMHGGAGRQCQPLCSRAQTLAEHRRVAHFFAWQSRAAVPAPALISSPLQRCKAWGASGPASAHYNAHITPYTLPYADPSRGPAKSACVCRSIARLLMCTVPGAQKKAEHKSEQALFHEVLLGGRRPAA